MKNILKRPGKWLLVSGLALIIVAMIFLRESPDIAQYIAPAGDMPAAVKAWDAARADFLGENVALAYVDYQISLYRDGESADCALWCAHNGWFEASLTLLERGRYFSEYEYLNGGNVIIIDSDIAFKLFRGEECLGEKLLMGEVEYEIIGVTRAKDMAGDTAERDAFIPLSTAIAAEMKPDYALLCGETSAALNLNNAGVNALGAGDFINLPKEVMRATMATRIFFIVFALYLILRALKYWVKRTRAAIKAWNEEVLNRYFRDMLPGLMLKSALLLLGYIAILAAAGGVLMLIIRPLYVFTEWVPEVIAEWSSISERVSEIADAFSNPVRYQTREIATIRIWGAVARWGVYCLLAGGALFKKWNLKKDKAAKAS